jgi:hypothetical protein
MSTADLRQENGADVKFSMPLRERLAVTHFEHHSNSALARLYYLMLDPIYRKPRFWSNLVIRELAPHFAGRILNCSGWADEDKFGGHYRDYFKAASAYEVSNYNGGEQHGMYSTLANSIPLDLEQPLRPELRDSFDCVLSHTVLEHVFNVQRAVENICAMTADAAVICVPWTQLIHVMEGKFGDYWRFTPECLERLFAPHGLHTVCHHGTDIPGSSVYFVSVFSRRPERYRQLASNHVPSGDDMYSNVRWRNAVKYLIRGGNA